MSRHAHILIAEDDRSLRESLHAAVGLDGHEVSFAKDGAQALTAMAETSPDLLLLDVSMPNVDGLTVARRLRERGDRTPILMLTARDTVPDRVAGLEAGADDYLVKPFALDELLARVRALLRRTLSEDSCAALVVGLLVLDPSSRTAILADQMVQLTKTEFDLLELFMRNVGLVLSRDTIYQRIWGLDYEPGSKSLDVHISYLRRKLEASDQSRLIKTVRGVGYVMAAP